VRRFVERRDVIVPIAAPVCAGRVVDLHARIVEASLGR
jgi:hypothetical protein